MESHRLSLPLPPGCIATPGASAAGPPEPTGACGPVQLGLEDGGLEEQALTRARAGQTDAFRRLVRAHQDVVYGLALRLLGVREDAQELSQDVFLLLHRHLGSIVSPLHLRFWLRRTVCHRAIDRLRRRSRYTVLSLDVAAEQEMAGQEMAGQGGDLLVDRQLRALVAQLPATPRAVLLLRYQEDLDPPEIARTLGLPLNTVKSHLRRSLALLRRRCGDLWAADRGGGHT
jgi:RNA polymerase sigma-70 factor (ECF subfamily)